MSFHELHEFGKDLCSSHTLGKLANAGRLTINGLLRYVEDQSDRVEYRLEYKLCEPMLELSWMTKKQTIFNMHLHTNMILNGNRALAEVGWGEEDSIRSSALIFSAIKRIFSIHTFQSP